MNIPPGTMTQGQALEVIALAVAAKAEELGIDPSDIVVSLTFNVQRIENFAGETASVRAVKIFELNVKNQNGTDGQIAKPVLITWDFTPGDLARVGGNISNLLMIGYDETTKTWSAAKQVSSTSTSVTFEVPHFSLWAFATRNTVATQPAPPVAATPGTTVPTTVPTTPPAQAETPAAAAAAGAGAAVPPGAVIPRPANTGTGIPLESGMNEVRPYALAVICLGVVGGIALRTVRRRS